MIKDTFANRLKKIMLIKNIKAVELSNKTGISKSQISHWLSGSYKAKQDSLTILSNYLGVPEAWLMGYDVELDEKKTTDIFIERYKSLSPEDKKFIDEMIEYKFNKGSVKDE